MERPLEGKVALVTGAARGVGKALAVELGRLGAHVVVTARSAVPAEGALAGTIGETLAEIESAGGRGSAVRADLLDRASRAELVSTVLAEHGGVDILVNNAADTGDHVFQGFWQTDVDTWAQQFELNVFAMYDLMHTFAPAMRERGGGFIVNIGSAREFPEGIEGSSRFGDVDLGAAYPTSKVAIYTMTTLLARELAEVNIVAFTLTPGSARTERFEAHARTLGIDAAIGIPPQLSARALSTVLLSDDPMKYAGRFLEAATFADAPAG